MSFLVDGTVVAVIAPAAQVQVPLAPIVAVGKTVASSIASSEVDVSYLRVWIDDPVMAQEETQDTLQSGLTAVVLDASEEFDSKLNRTTDFAKGAGSGVWYFASTTIPEINMIVGLSHGSSSGVVEPARDTVKPIGVHAEGAIAGLISGNIPVITSGRTQVLVSLSGGTILSGDDIAVSSTSPGIGVRTTRSGYIIGHAIEAFDPPNGLGVCMNGSATSTATSTCVGLVTIQLAPGWNEGSGGIFSLFTEGFASYIATSSGSSTPSFGVKEFLDAMFTTIANWLASATNGIADIFATYIHAQRVDTKTLCLDNVCVTKTQLEQLLAGSGVAPALEATTSLSSPVVTPIDSSVNTETASTSSSTPANMTILPLIEGNTASSTQDASAQ